MQREVKLPAQGHTAARYHEHFNPRSWHTQEAQDRRAGPAGSVTPPVSLWAAGQAPDQVLGFWVDTKDAGIAPTVLLGSQGRDLQRARPLTNQC